MRAIAVPSGRVERLRRAIPEVLEPLRAQLESGAFGTILLQDTLWGFVPESVFGPPIRRAYRAVEIVPSTRSVGLFSSVIVLERRG